MEKLLKLKAYLNQKRPASCEELPAIEIYKDQVLNYMHRQHPLQSEEDRLTGAMINNYIKSGILPRANGKKYSKEHLAYLTAICSLKQVLSVNETDVLLKIQPDITSPERFYSEYCSQIDDALTRAANSLDANLLKGELAAAALHLAISGYAQKLVCEKILDILKDKK